LKANTAEQRLKELGIELPAPPAPFGTYVEAVQTGNLLFLTGMLPTSGREPLFVGRVGAELDVQAGYKAARVAALNGLAIVREHLGSLDKVTRVVRIGVSVATSGDVRNHPQVADGASELLQEVFGKERNPCRLVIGVASLPLGGAGGDRADLRGVGVLTQVRFGLGQESGLRANLPQAEVRPVSTLA
jgi:enamine deaminase RidA (YjgF/YER057c/UK114 family)